MDKRKRLIEIQQRLAALDAQARQENRDLTDAERNEWESLVKEAEDLKRAIQSEELRSGQLDGINEFLSQSQRGGIPRNENINIHGDQDKELDDYNQGRNWRSAGHFLRDLSLGRVEHMRAATQNTQEGALGGYLVPTVYMPNVFSITPPGAIVRPRATIIPADSGAPDAEVQMPKMDHTATDGSALYGGAKVFWTGEGAPVTKTDVKLELESWKPQEVAAYIDATNALLRNSPASASVYMTQLERALIAAMDMNYLRGNGVKKPLGVIGSGAALKITRATADAVGFDDLADMLAHALIAGMGFENYVWVATQSLMKDIITLKDTAGNAIYIAGDATRGITASLFGIPIIWTGRAPVKGSNGDIGLYDFSYYAIKDGYGPAIETSPHVRFLNSITVIKALANTDGKPLLDVPIILEDGDTEVSPFVILAA